MTHKKKIAFAGRWSPLDKLAWSGTYHNSYEAIKEHFEVDFFHYKWSYFNREFLLLQKQIQKVKHKKLSVEFLTSYAKHFGKKLEKDLAHKNYDAIFVPSAPQLIAYCSTGIPLIYLTDATFIQLQGYYPSFSELPDYNLQQGIAMDQQTFAKSAHCLLASDWTKNSAIQDYQIPASKITVAPLGANIPIQFLQETPQLKQTKVCRLLFLGVEWDRKGGSIVVETFRQLQQTGMAVTLHIVGCTPPEPLLDKDITIIPFLNKNDPAELTELMVLLKNSSFLFLPSRAECAGVVFCESSAFGLPSISTDTGGISTYVTENVNGYLLPLKAGAMEYATLIRNKFSDSDAYTQLCINSRKLYEEKLNWEAWGFAFKNIVDNL